MCMFLESEKAKGTKGENKLQLLSFALLKILYFANPPAMTATKLRETAYHLALIYHIR